MSTISFLAGLHRLGEVAAPSRADRLSFLGRRPPPSLEKPLLEVAKADGFDGPIRVLGTTSQTPNSAMVFWIGATSGGGELDCVVKGTDGIWTVQMGGILTPPAISNAIDFIDQQAACGGGPPRPTYWVMGLFAQCASTSCELTVTYESGENWSQPVSSEVLFAEPPVHAAHSLTVGGTNRIVQLKVSQRGRALAVLTMPGQAGQSIG